MSLHPSLMLPIAALSGCAVGVVVYRTLRLRARERRALRLVYSFTATVAATLWVGVALVAFVGGAGSQGPVQYAMQEPSGESVFRVRGDFTLVGFLSVPASLIPIGALFARQSTGERVAGVVSILALWLAITTVCTPPFMPTV